MYYFTSKKEADARAAMEAAGRREAAAILPLVEDVIWQFDRKVYNCRFEKALQEALAGKAPGRIYVRKDHYWVLVEYLPKATPGCYSITVAQMKTGDLVDGKRINGQLLSESLKERCASLLEAAAVIEEQSARVDEYRRQFEQLQRSFEELRDGINSTVRDIYGLNYRVARS